MNIVVNSRFNPFTYEQLVKPLEDYTKVYNEVEALYAGLSDKADPYIDVVAGDPESDAYKMVHGYTDDLDSVVSDFSKGMTLANRRKLLTMKRRYSKEIAPVIRADTARQEAIKFRRDTKARDNSAIFKVDNFSIDDFLHGKTIDEDYISGKDILARTSAKSEALGKALFSDPDFEKFLGGQVYKLVQQNGMSPEMFYAVINNQLDNPKIPDTLREKLQGFRQIMDDELANVSDWGDAAKQQVLNNVVTGMYAGLAKPTYNYVDNKEYMSAAERDASAARWAGIQIQRDAQALDREKWTETLKQSKIENGELPYKEDENTKYYRRGDYVWTETKKDGKWVKSDIQTSPEKLQETRVKNGWGTSYDISPIYFVADNEDKAKNPHWYNKSKNSIKGKDSQYTRVVSWDGLSKANQEFIKKELEDQKVDWSTFNTNRITVYVNDYAAEDDGLKVVISNPSGGSSNAGIE